MKWFILCTTRILVSLCFLVHSIDAKSSLMKFFRAEKKSDNFQLSSIKVLARKAFSVVWCTNEQGEVFACTPDVATLSKDWHKIEAPAAMFSFAIGNDLAVWGISVDKKVFMRQGVCGSRLLGESWIAIDGPDMNNLAIDRLGQIWGAATDGSVYLRKGVADTNPAGEEWEKIDNFKMVSIGAGSADSLWGISSSGEVYVRLGIKKENPNGLSWSKVEGLFSDIEVGGNDVWVSNQQGELFYRDGITELKPEGSSWTKMNGELVKDFSVSPDGKIWILAKKTDNGSNVFYRDSSNDLWEKFGGNYTSIAVGGYADTRADENSYTHIGYFYDGDVVYSSDLWKFSHYKEGWAKFKIRSGSTGIIKLSTEKNGSTGYVIYLSSEQGKNLIASMDGRLSVVAQSPIIKNSFEWQDCWILIVQHKGKQVIEVGVGRDPGVAALIKLVDEKTTPIEYISFGGDNKAIHEFKGIATTATVAQTEVKVPGGFKKVGGFAKRVSVGNHEGLPLIMAIAFNDSLHQYDASLGDIPWKSFDMNLALGGVIQKVKDVSASSDGTLGIVSGDDGKFYLYDWENSSWVLEYDNPDSVQFDRVAVGNKNCIWALDKIANNLYRLTKKGWQLQKHSTIFNKVLEMDAGLDGLVIAITKDLKLYMFNPQKNIWLESYNNNSLNWISIGSREHVAGIRNFDAESQVWFCPNGAWQRGMAGGGEFAYGVEHIAINANESTIVMVVPDGSIYMLGDGLGLEETYVMTQSATPFEVIAQFVESKKIQKNLIKKSILTKVGKPSLEPRNIGVSESKNSSPVAKKQKEKELGSDVKKVAPVKENVPAVMQSQKSVEMSQDNVVSDIVAFMKMVKSASNEAVVPKKESIEQDGMHNISHDSGVMLSEKQQKNIVGEQKTVEKTVEKKPAIVDVIKNNSSIFLEKDQGHQQDKSIVAVKPLALEKIKKDMPSPRDMPMEM